MFLAAAFLAALSINSAAQVAENKDLQRVPARPARPYVVLPAQSLSDLERKLRPENKGEELIGGDGMQLRVAVQHENNKEATAAEVHDASDDVYYVLEGAATLTLGGQLDAPREVEPGEWRATRIAGGQNVEITKGDLIIVPRGTPHARSTAGKTFSMILIKIFAVPIGAQQAQTTQQTTQTLNQEASLAAIVKPSHAEFRLPLPARQQWKWRQPETQADAREYRMDVTVNNAGQEYTFGVYLWKRAGAKPDKGSFSDFLKEAQVSVFGRGPQSRGYSIIRDAGVEAKQEDGHLVITVKGRKNVERLFSSRPAEVTFKVEALGDSPASKAVPVNYQD